MSRQRKRTAFADALRIIGFRDLSVRHLEERLRARTHSSDEAVAAVARCIELDYVNDYRFGVDRAGSILRRRPCGRLALHRDLQRQGLPETMISRVVDEAYEEAGGEGGILAEAVRRWVEQKGEPVDWPGIRRCSNHLGRRGFSAGDVQAALSCWLDDLNTRGHLP